MSSIFDSNSTSPPPPGSRYRALNPLAVTSTVLGALSIITFLHWALAVIPLAGIVVGWCAWKQIRKAPDEWTGLTLVRVGIGLSAAFWLFGYGWLVVARVSEVPPGYERITYEKLQPDPATPTEPIPQSALDMQDRKVYVQGYMQSGRRQTGIKEFILCPTNGECPFCTPDPKPTEKIRVILPGDMETSYTTHPVGAAGRFRVDINDPSGIPYGLEVDQPLR
jgi:hypothetical protein